MQGGRACFADLLVVGMLTMLVHGTAADNWSSILCADAYHNSQQQAIMLPTDRTYSMILAYSPRYEGMV